MRTFRSLPMFVLTATMAAGCPGGAGEEGDDDGGQLPLGDGPCDRASDCQGDVCVALIDGGNPPVYCTQRCAGDCPEGFYCDSSTFSLIGLDFCRPGEPPTPDDPPASEEPARLPCTEDPDCDAGQVCATSMGERGCTIACAVEDDCTPPSFGGVTFDLATCGPDETPGQTRTVCVPDPSCFPNPQTCISGFP